MLILQIVDAARAGVPRAKAWFKSDSWVKIQRFFDAETIAIIEEQALATDNVRERAERTKQSDETRKRKSEAQLARWEQYRREKAEALAAQPVEQVKLTPEERRARRIERVRIKNGYYERQAQQPTSEELERLRQERAQRKRDVNNARYRRLKTERAAQIQHIPTGVTHGNQPIGTHIS
jgi:hypothetical protein